MAVYRWTGATDGDWEAAAGTNWQNENGTPYALGAHPGAGNDYEDEVILDGSPTTQLEAGDKTGLAVLRSFRVGSDYDDYVGSSAGEYLIIDAQEVVIQATYAPAVYLQGGTSIDTCTVMDGTAVYLKGVYGSVVILKGTVEFNTTATIGTALTIGSVSDEADATVTIPNITSLCATVNAYAGTVDCSEGMTTLNLSGGVWTQTTGNITTVNIHGGEFDWVGGNITTLYLRAGSVSTDGGTTARRIGTAEVFPNTVLDLDSGLGNIMVTGYIRNYGGTVVWGGGMDTSPHATQSYAGASDDCYGIPPQVINSGGTATVDGDRLYLGPHDRLQVYCITGAIAAGGEAAFKLEENTDAAGTGAADIAGKTASFTDADDNKTKLITVWGYELTAGKPWVNAVVTTTTAFDAYISCVYVRSTF